MCKQSHSVALCLNRKRGIPCAGSNVQYTIIPIRQGICNVQLSTCSTRHKVRTHVAHVVLHEIS